jgi:hypothetical protein
MSNLSVNNLQLYKDKRFVEKHIGGKNQDTPNSFNNQANILANKNNDYERLIDYNNNLEREKNKNDNYVERLDNEKHTSVYRINNYPTYIDDVNYSNPIIYPKDYNMYFDYLNKKNINSINTQVVKKKNYINIDSASRDKQTFFNIKEYINLKDYSIEFTNQSNFLKIYIDNAKMLFNENDYIILKGFKNYTILYEKLKFFFINNSSTVILDITPNFIKNISYYDIFIIIEGVTNQDNIKWKNIPLYLINKEQKIQLIKINGENKISFNLPIIFYSDNELDLTLESNSKITFTSVGNYPINLINSNSPLTFGYLNPYLIINEVQNNYIKLYLLNVISINDNILLNGIWENNVFKTGTNIQIGIIYGFIKGFPNPNSFVVNLDYSYNNVCSIKMISSEIPNIVKNISNKTNYESDNLKYISKINNKFYWDNILDEGIYNIELEPGYYDYIVLKKIIEKKVSLVKRNFYMNDLYLQDNNLIEINFNTETNITNINFFNIYSYPNCLDNITELNNDKLGNQFLIRIYHINHNLKENDIILISDSIDYYNIKSDYINANSGHKIIRVINNNYYEILIKNINKIENVGNTKGGNQIKIKYPAIFRLFFNFPDTFGDLIGFNLVGVLNSITYYSSYYSNYTINNLEPYFNDIKKILIVNNTLSPIDLEVTYRKTNYRYILLLAENFNINYNSNGQQYFYKFLLNGQPNTYLFNTFVQTPIYFNPPIKSITKFEFTFISPDGSLVNFGNLDSSFTLEITTVDNIPENTNISTNIARL